MIKLEHVSKAYSAGIPALNDVNLEIDDGEFVFVCGDSGSGKSTLIKLLLKELDPTDGTITVDGRNLARIRHKQVPKYRRNVGVVFQDFRLLKDRNVYENVAFALKVIGASTAVIKKKVPQMLSMVGLAAKYKSKPKELSGGEQQRVAIARALVNEPKVLLLDEPLGALDLKLRQEMQYELIRLKNELGITFVFVTHDQEEALTMSDTIVVMNQGYIQQIGTPEMIYNEPVNAFVADFIGDSNIIDGIMMKDRVVEILGTRIPCVDEGFGTNTPVDVVIRPEDVEIVAPGEGFMDGDITSIIFKGVHYEIEIMAGGFEWLVDTTQFYTVGTHVGIRVIPFNIQIMNKPESEDEEAAEIDV